VRYGPSIGEGPPSLVTDAMAVLVDLTLDDSQKLGGEGGRVHGGEVQKGRGGMGRGDGKRSCLTRW
jgi:hypothetical protein